MQDKSDKVAWQWGSRGWMIHLSISAPHGMARQSARHGDRIRQGRVTFITTLRNSTALTKIEAQVSFLTLNLSYLFFSRRFFLI